MTSARPSFLLRFVGRALLLLHACVAGLLPVADARAEASGLTPIAHVESEGKACVPVHDHAACQVCRVLRQGGAPPSTAPLPPLVACAPRPTELDVVIAAMMAVPDPHPTRAPPTA